jgi:hypothetical protein
MWWEWADVEGACGGVSVPHWRYRLCIGCVNCVITLCPWCGTAAHMVWWTELVRTCQVLQSLPLGPAQHATLCRQHIDTSGSRMFDMAARGGGGEGNSPSIAGITGIPNLTSWKCTAANLLWNPELLWCGVSL